MKSTPLHSTSQARNRFESGFVKGLRIFLLCLILALVPWEPESTAETKPSLAVFPFLIEAREDPGRGAVCPVCSGVFRRGDIPLGSRATMNRLIRQRLEDQWVFQLLPTDRVEEALAVTTDRTPEQTPVSTSLKIGKELNADYLLLGFIARFQERVGSALGVEKPASVAFDLHLYRVRDGKMVWEGRFDETQRPLSENLLKLLSFLRRGGTWLTAVELADSGLEEMLKRLPDIEELEGS